MSSNTIRRTGTLPLKVKLKTLSPYSPTIILVDRHQPSHKLDTRLSLPAGPELMDVVPVVLVPNAIQAGRDLDPFAIQNADLAM